MRATLAHVNYHCWRLHCSIALKLKYDETEYFFIFENVFFCARLYRDADVPHLTSSSFSTMNTVGRRRKNPNRMKERAFNCKMHYFFRSRCSCCTFKCLRFFLCFFLFSKSKERTEQDAAATALCIVYSTVMIVGRLLAVFVGTCQN